MDSRVVDETGREMIGTDVQKTKIKTEEKIYKSKFTMAIWDDLYYTVYTIRGNRRYKESVAGRGL